MKSFIHLANDYYHPLPTTTTLYLLPPFTYYHPLPTVTLYLLSPFTYYHPLPTTTLYLLPPFTYYHPLPTTTLYLLSPFTYYHPLPTTTLYLLPPFTYYHPLPTTTLYLLPPFTYYHPLPTITLYLLSPFTYYHPLPTITLYLLPPFTSADVHKLHVNVVLPTFKGLNSVPFSFFTCGVKCQSDVYHSYTAMATAMRNELDTAYERDKEAAHQAMEDGQIEPLPSRKYSYTYIPHVPDVPGRFRVETRTENQCLVM